MKLLRTSPLVLLLSIAATPSLAVKNGYNTGTGGVVLRASVPMGTVLGTGDRIAFEYQTREDAAVLVYNIDSQGYVHLLHPTGGPEVSRARQSYAIPAEGPELVVDTQSGVEFVFALAVDDPSSIDSAEMERLRGAEPVRIDGDPFVAANMIAAQLVRDVSQRNAHFGYTYFYVNDRVEYPCYLCGACDGTADDPACDDYRVVQAFDRRESLAYPLQRGYETVSAETEIVTEDGARVVVPEGSDVDVNFYPYGVEARAVDPFYTSLWNDTWWYDPLYWYGPYYPYYGPGWSFSVGFGWGWGWWGGYYCSGWYAPCGWGYDPWCGYYGGGGGGGSYTTPEKFKAKYKSDASTLTASRNVAAHRDGDLRIASKDVQKSLSRPTQSAMRSKTASVTRSTFNSKGKGTSVGVPRAKSSMRGSSSHIKAGGPGAPRGGAVPRVKSTTGASSSRKGVSNAPRGGGGYKSRAVAPGTRGGSSRQSVGRGSSSSTPRMKGSSSQSRSYSAPSSRSSGASRGGGMKSSAPRSSGGGGRGKGR